ncbi:MAG: Gfo/Idh/MocA family oxidoreductase [Armatimonas sp.]
MNRRQLLAAGASLAAIPAMAESATPQTSSRRTIGPNDKIRVGLIGAGGSRGGFRQGLGDTIGISHQPGVEVVAVCDLDLLHLDEAANALKGPNGTLPDKYTDFRYLIARPDIDAVVIGTPDHWHSIVASHAMKAGKDIYCEKPMTLMIGEGIELVKTARKMGTVWQTGSQQRSDQRFRTACELVRNGRLGKLKQVVAHLPGGTKGGPFDVVEKPHDFLFDMWLGPSEPVPYLEERTHGSFRHWYSYSGGMMTDWGAHHLDIAQWGMGRDGSGPVKIKSQGKMPDPDPTRRSFECALEFKVTYTYADGVELIATNEGENGVHFYGENGQWIFVSRSRIDASDPKLLTDPLPANATKLYVSDNHQRNFIDCIRSRQRPICDVEIGHRSASVCHLGNLSIRLGFKELQWDPKKETFTGANAAEANALKFRPYHGGWSL